jgi:hypothetical protein
MSRTGYQYSVGSGCGLYARCDVRSFTEDVDLLASSRANHYRTRIDANSRC